MLKERKGEIIESLTKELGQYSTMIVADPRGLTVAEITKLRGTLRENGSHFRVAKNTLARIAARASGREELVEMLNGPTGITLIDGDVAAAAKALADFGKASGKLEIRGAYIDGTLFDQAQVKKLATLPPKAVLQSQVLGTLIGPLQGLLGLFNAAPRDFVVVLDQVIQKRQAEEAA